jgi:hypothetical protein
MGWKEPLLLLGALVGAGCLPNPYNRTRSSRSLCISAVALRI